MRRFLILSHRVPVSGAFSLNDLAGGGGRVDEIARCVSTAFLVSNDLRRDTELTVLFAQAPPPAARRMHFVGERIRHLNPDERSTAALIKNALVRSIPFDHPIEASPGLFVGPTDPLPELARALASGPAYWLTESGAPLGVDEPAPDATVVLGDVDDPRPEEVELLERSDARKRSLGPISLRASQCIDVWHNRADLVAGGAPGLPPERSPTAVVRTD